MMKVFLTGLLFLLFGYSVSAQNRVEKIDDLITYCHENKIFNGNILIAEKGKIIYHKSLGLADFNNKRRLTKNTSFCIASISKPITAMGIMILKEKGQLKYSDKLGQFFPELPVHLHQLTIRSLLTHTSGLARTHAPYKDGLTNDEVFQNLIKTTSLSFETGTKIKYSNTAFILLAMIIEKIEGIGFEQFLQENIFTPLGMTNTFLFSKEDHGRKDIAIGYNGFGEKSDYNVLNYGSGGIYSTEEDLFRWSQAFTNGKIVSKQTIQEAIQEIKSKTGETLDFRIRKLSWGYGFGLFIYRDENKGMIGHSGAFDGFYNIFIKNMNVDREIIILSNNGRLFSVFGLSDAIRNILNGQPFEYPKISIDLVIRQKSYHNVDEGIEEYHQLKKAFPNKYKFDNSSELNRLGYYLIKQKKIKSAIKIFQLLVSEFPNSSNAYDSLGEAYYLNKQYKASLKSYQKAIKLDKNNSNAKQMIEKIED